jgi:anthranilate phosphoribosyltransferase
MSDSFKPLLAKIALAQALTPNEAREAFELILSNEASPAQMAAFLMGLRVRGETVEEITAGAQTLRSKMVPVQAPSNAMDIVGTGGDGTHSYNISTATAFVVAGAGIPVAKHGNRAISSKSGAADVLMALGVNVEISPEQISDCINEAGIGFMFAPKHHAAMRFVGPVRQEMGVRTVFNVLGPLSNPANVKQILLGVYDERWIMPLAHVLKELGMQSAMVVHGHGGYDEISPTGPTKAAVLKDNKIFETEFGPIAFGMPLASPEDLKGGDAAFNASALRSVLMGKPSAYLNSVLMNAGAALMVAGKVDNLGDGISSAREVIENGKALKALETLIVVSNRP